MVIFTYKNLQVMLPSPKLQDSRNLDIPAVIDRAKDGTIWAYRRQSKPIVRLGLAFEKVNRPKVLEVIAFLRATMGSAIQYKDYRGHLWNGKVLNKNFEATHVKIRDNQFSLEFEGQLA